MKIYADKDRLRGLSPFKIKYREYPPEVYADESTIGGIFI